MSDFIDKWNGITLHQDTSELEKNNFMGFYKDFRAYLNEQLPDWTIKSCRLEQYRICGIAEKAAIPIYFNFQTSPELPLNLCSNRFTDAVMLKRVADTYHTRTGKKYYCSMANLGYTLPKVAARSLGYTEPDEGRGNLAKCFLERWHKYNIKDENGVLLTAFAKEFKKYLQEVLPDWEVQNYRFGRYRLSGFLEKEGKVVHFDYSPLYYGPTPNLYSDSYLRGVRLNRVKDIDSPPTGTEKSCFCCAVSKLGTYIPKLIEKTADFDKKQESVLNKLHNTEVTTPKSSTTRLRQEVSL